MERELSLIEATEARLVDGIARGDAMDPLLARHKAEEASKRALAAELEVLVTGVPGVRHMDLVRAREKLRRRTREMKALLRRDVPGARDVLRILVPGHLKCEPAEEAGQRGYRITGEGSYLELLSGNLSTEVVTPAGFEPAISTLKGSRPWPG